MRSLHRELVGCADEGKVCELCNFRSGRVAEVWSCVDACSHCCATEGEPIHAFQRILDALKIVSKYTGVSRPLLPKRKRCGVLHMRAPDLNDIFPLLGVRCDRIAQRSHRGYKPLLYVHRHRNVHGSGERIV